MTAPLNGAELLARIRPVLREESTQICMRPDLIDAFHEAEAALAQARTGDAAGQRLGSGISASTKTLAKKVQALEKEIEECAITFRFRAMTKDEWRALCDNHKPRKGDQLDAYVGYDRDAVNDEAVRKCLFDPVFDDASWAELMGVINPSEWKELRETVNLANRSVVDTPKSVLASQTLSKPGSASRRPAAGE